jgi:hypothetical protein
MKIFGWDLVWGCIRKQRCVMRKISVDATFDLDPKLHNNSLPLCIFETNEDFWLIFGGRMYPGTKVCRAKEYCRCDLWPWPCDLETEIPFCSVVVYEWRFFIDIRRNDVTRSDAFMAFRACPPNILAAKIFAYTVYSMYSRFNGE